MEIGMRTMLLKVISRYLAANKFKCLINDLASLNRVDDRLFVETLKKHFDFERWEQAPLIKQDVWLHNYFKYEYKGKLKCSGLMNKYYFTAFVYDDALFFDLAEELNKMKPSLPKGVKFIPNEFNPQVANHLLSDKSIPGSAG